MEKSCIAPKCQRPRTAGALFCTECVRAPAVQRAGWVSAENRRRRLAGTVVVQSELVVLGMIEPVVIEPDVDISNVATRLWVGSAPPFDRHLPGFDMLVLCAQEIQPETIAFTGQTIRCPLPDTKLTADELRRAVSTSGVIARALVANKRVLVTCATMGKNRSAFVAALAIGRVVRTTGPELVERMRVRRRPDCLDNAYFRAYLTKLVANIKR